ncbi:hypothetical protein DIPPA_19934 [Diplonema papillatum]|nr:hypothetical protein DIPPA_19934 [Diplonema papillatum]
MSLAAALTRWRDLAFFAADAGAADAAFDAIFASATVLLVLFVLFRGHALAESVCSCVVRVLARRPAAAYGAAALCLLGLAAAQAPRVTSCVSSSPKYSCFT